MLDALASGADLPIVLVEDRVVSTGGVDPEAAVAAARRLGADGATG